MGKHALAGRLSEALGRGVLDLSSAAARLGAAGGDDGSYVDTEVLRDALPGHMEADAVVVGHLAPHVVRRESVERAIVLRRSPYELERVYLGRGYPAGKALQNLQSEILGVVAYDAAGSFGRDLVAQIDTTPRDGQATLDAALRLLDGGGPGDEVDWLAAVRERGDLRRYFSY